MGCSGFPDSLGQDSQSAGSLRWHLHQSRQLQPLHQSPRRWVLKVMTLSLPLPIDERLNAPYKVVALAEVVAPMGIDEETLLDGTGLLPEQLHNAQTRISVRQFSQACRNAIRAGAAPGTAFEVGSRMHISSYGMYGYALLCCETLRDVARLAVRFHRLATPAVDMVFREEASEAVWSYDRIVEAEVDDPLYRFLIEMQCAIHLTLGRDLVGPSFQLSRVLARYPRPADSEIYHRYLGCPASFDQPTNELRYAATLLSASTTYPNPLTVAMASDICEKMLEEGQRDSGVAGRVFRLLMKVPGKFDDMETIAARLNTTPRTLRRRLQTEGTSYQDILAEVRCQLAKEYLRTTRLSTEHIADALGFSDAANFRHAFRRWTGKTTSEFRSGVPLRARAA